MTMTPEQSNCIVLQNAPLTDVNFNMEADDATFKLTQKPLRKLEQGEILIKTLYLSNDPTQRAWIQKGITSDRMYVDPVKEGDVMRSMGLGQVVESNSSKYAAGAILSCSLKWADYSIIQEDLVYNEIKDTSVPLTMYLDIFGMTGLTAYFGLMKVAQLKSSDTIVISAASGATGSACVQIAKNIIGCKKVIGISGGSEKCEYVKSIGADECVDYRDADFQKNLRKAIGDEKKVDVYFDGVGGKILDTMLNYVKSFGQVIACGAIAGYNDVTQARVLNWSQIIVQRLTVKGFIVIDFMKEYPEGVAALVKWVKEGKLKTNSSTFTLIDLSKEDTLAKIPETWGLLFDDKKGPGKLLTKVANPKL